MAFNLNPFTILHETDYSPYSRILRSSFFTKIEDTWNIFLGESHYSKQRAGILDFLVVGIPLTLLISLVHWVVNTSHSNQVAKILEYPLFLLGVLAYLVRITLASIMTLLVSPLVAVVHVASYVVARRDISQALEVNGVYCQAVGDTEVPMSLKEALEKTNTPYDYDSGKRPTMAEDTTGVYETIPLKNGGSFIIKDFYNLSKDLPQKRSLYRLNLFCTAENTDRDKRRDKRNEIRPPNK